MSVLKRKQPQDPREGREESAYKRRKSLGRGGSDAVSPEGKSPVVSASSAESPVVDRRARAYAAAVEVYEKAVVARAAVMRKVDGGIKLCQDDCEVLGHGVPVAPEPLAVVCSVAEEKARGVRLEYEAKLTAWEEAKAAVRGWRVERC